MVEPIMKKNIVTNVNDSITVYTPDNCDKLTYIPNSEKRSK